MPNPLRGAGSAACTVVRSLHAAPSQAHVSFIRSAPAIGPSPPRLPPNSTAVPATTSYVIAAAERARGVALPIFALHCDPSQLHVSESRLPSLSPPNSTISPAPA